jgi:hypothetical protein
VHLSGNYVWYWETFVVVVVVHAYTWSVPARCFPFFRTIIPTVSSAGMNGWMVGMDGRGERWIGGEKGEEVRVNKRC